MDLQFNQYQKQNIQYLTPLKINKTLEDVLVDVPLLGQVQDKAIRLANNVKFAKAKNQDGTYNNYYISFEILQLDSIQDIVLYLIQSNIEQGKQKIKTISIPASFNKDNYYKISFVFNTIDDVFNGILLELNRTIKDDNQTKSSSLETNISQITTETNSDINEQAAKASREIVLQNINIYKIKNLLETNTLYQKIGIQGRPGSIFCINGEEIHIGKSGLYEMFYDIPVYFIGAVTQSNLEKDYFVIDYQYDKKEEQGNGL